ncbi:tetratricopeptide repeat protein [Bacteroides heparinolyticus]|uniref:tetratricopeptide repeat protein n=1 Tax=Prevotella heparinolytica TaxID=28113 RepID=UPI00359F7B58
MSKINWLSDREKELRKFAAEYEAFKTDKKPLYLDADDIADLSNWYAVRHRYATAIELVEYGLRLHPGNTTLLVELSYLFLDTQKKKEAQEVLESITEDSSEVTILKANFLLEEGKVEEADELLNHMADQDDVINIIDVCYAYIDMRFPEKALPWLERGRKQHADREIYLAAAGDCYFSMGEIEKASGYFNQLIDINPYSAPYWIGLARCYFEQQVLDKTIEACDYALVADEECADAYTIKGHSFFQLGNEEMAMENYLQAEKFGALSSSFINTFIGMNKVAKGKWEEGYVFLEKAIKENTDYSSIPITSSSLYAHAAFCLHKMGETPKAHQYCQIAYELNPEDINSYLIEGRIYMEEGEYEKGAEKWDRAVEYAPYAETWYEIGLYCMEINQLNYAKKAFEQVKQMSPDFEDINEKLASLYMLLKDKENFTKYNSLCKHPLEWEKVEKLKQLLQDDNQNELIQIIKDIFDGLQ